MGDRPFNPDRPCVIGQQWQPNISASIPLEQVNGLAMILQAETSDEIGTVWTAVNEMLGATSGLAIEVYDVTTGGDPALPTLPPIVTNTYLPSGDISGFGVGASGYNGTSASTTPPFYPYVNSTTRTPGFFLGQFVGQNVFMFSAVGSNFNGNFQFSGVAGSLTGAWITRVRVRLQVSNLYFGTSVTSGTTVGVVPFLMVNGAAYFGSPQSISQTAPGTTVVFDVFENPTTGLQWTVSDVENFDDASGVQWGAGFIGIGVGATTSYLVVEEVQLQVDYAATDLRLAIGIGAPTDAGSPTLGHQGWVPIALVSGQDGSPAPLTLVPGNFYMFMFKSTLNSLVAIQQLREQFAPDPTQISAAPPNWIAANIQLSPQTRRPLQAIPSIPFEGYLNSCILEKTDTTISLDTQPYDFVTPTQGRQVGWTTLPNGLFHFSEISSTQWMHQEFTVDTNTTFGYMQVVTSLVTTTTQDPNQPLNLSPPMTINIRKASDDSLIAGPFDVEVTDLVAPVTAWQRVGIDIGTVNLLAGTQYYWDITSNAVSSVSWQVQVAIANSSTGATGPPTGPPTGTNVATWGVGVDDLIVYFNGTPTTYVGSAAEIFVATRPPVPGSFTAIASGESECNIDSIVIDWTAPALTCGSHGYYDLQRSDDGGGTWNAIAKITDADVLTFTDYESKRNLEASYRIREVRADGSPSDWSATETATAVLSECGYAFVTNEHPAYNVFYPDIKSPRNFGFPQVVSILQPYGQNYQIALHGLEYRGRTFATELAVRAQVPGCDPEFTTCDDTTLTGTDVFNPLQTICRADLSYVCVHDEHGDRYFANVTAPTADWYPTAKEIFNQAISVVEVTDVPSTPDVASG